jgi:transposase
LSLPSDIESCHKLILQQQEQIQLLMVKILELEARLNENSRNSHRPPSSDGLKKQAALPREHKHKRGGLKGHKGDTLKMVAKPDEVIDLCPEICSCGASLSAVEKHLIEKRQVFDLPPPKVVVREYRQVLVYCPKCGRRHLRQFPAEAKAPVQYGSGVRSLAVLLNIDYKLPVKKISQLFEDLFGLPLNEATVQAATQRCHEQLEEVEQGIRERLCQSLVNHFDETGVRCEGKLHWLHSCSNERFTSLFVHPRRGRKALESAASILPHYRGWSLHDCWQSYFSFSNSRHAVCNAHILRELKALADQDRHWARWFRRFLLTLYRLSSQGTKTLTPEQLQKAQRIYSTICTYADQEEPPPKPRKGKGRKKATKGRNLLIRLTRYQEAVLAFTEHEQVPFTNNQAERDLRPAKIKLKVAGSFRTSAGADIYARIQGFISTVRKHQFNIFNELSAVFNNQPISIMC